ncbi:MAG: hypothetical protein ACOX47_09010 [Bacillota bacterium]
MEKDGITFVIDKQLAGYLPYVTICFRDSWLGKGLYVDATAYRC